MPNSGPRLRRTLAATELLLVAPAALFMTALFVRNLQPLPNEPAQSAQRLVAWFAGRVWTLWLLLGALPLIVLGTGTAAIVRSWRSDAALRRAAADTRAALRAHAATVLVAIATLAAAGVLAAVALHVATD